MRLRNFLLIILLAFEANAFAQPQDVEFHLNAKLLPGKKILKVKCDFHDPYVWVLAQNNEVYRVNGQTLVIDNYTSIFAPYAGPGFVDIVGLNQDVVFIATNSPNIVHYNNGSFTMIGSADGIPGIVNSIGIASGGIPNVVKSTPPQLMVATKTGFCQFNCNTDKLISKDSNDSKIYEATYRSELYKDSLAGSSNFINKDTVHFQPASYLSGDGALYTGYLWENNHEFGYSINTATLVNEATYGNNGVFSNYFWGTNNGLFQDNFDSSNNTFGPTPNHLPGIKINKLTNIYGLTSFGSGAPNDISPFIKQTLLIGTDVGFYFSSSVYNAAVAYNNLRTFSVFHDDELGNIVINDIAVIPTSTTVPLCESAVWLGANDGLYVLKPDYGAFLGSQQVSAAIFKGQPSTLTDLKLCSGETATAIVNTYSYPGNSFQWYKNGQELPGASAATLAITTVGDYYVVLYDPCEGLHMESNHLTVEIISSPVFTFNYPAKIQQCNNNPYTLQTTYDPAYHYRWYTNGVLNGNTTNTYTVTKSGKYKVEVSACTNSWVPSGEVEVDLINLPVPQITADKSVYCAEDIASLSINTPVDPSYTINWYQDGNLITADNNLISIQTTTGAVYTVTLSSTIGTCTQSSTALPVTFTPEPVFTFNYPDQLQYCAGIPITLLASGSNSYQYRWYKNDVLNGITTASLPVNQNGIYKVEVSSCTGSWVASKEVKVTFISLPAPVIVTDKQAYCSSDIATLSLSGPVGPDLIINWYKDNVLLPTGPGQTSITANLPGNYTVSLVNNTTNTDGTTCSQTSAVQALIFNPPPTVSIKQTVNTTFCTGQSVSLTASYSGGTVQWSTGETTSQISVTQTGTYKTTITSPAGCQADASIDVNFYPLPVFTLKDTSVCTYKKQVITLTGPPGFAGYDWNNGQSTSQTFQVSQPGNVSLTITDANGCQATQQIKVSEKCASVYIPNTFTPNGDGVNDTWIIEGLDETATVKVFTRWGSEVYQTIGYTTPWNGEYAGKKLATGVYYYLVTAKNGAQKFSGSLTIIY